MNDTGSLPKLNPSNHHNFMFMNIRSIQKNLLELQSAISIRRPTLLIVIETWLSPETPSSILGLNDYKIFRFDRESRGGGVLVAIKNCIKCSAVEIRSECEIVVVDISLCNNSSTRIIACYNPKTNDTRYLKTLQQTIIDALENIESYIIFGDFNLPDYSWSHMSYNTTQPYASFNDFINTMQPIYQLVQLPTRGSKLLDIILTNNPAICSDVGVTAPIGTSDHNTLFGNLKLHIPDGNLKGSFLDFYNADYNIIGNFLKIKFLSITLPEDPNNAWNIFNSLITNAISIFVKRVSFIKYKRRIICKENLRLYKKFHRIYGKWIKTHNLYYLNKYKLLKLQYRRNLKYKEVLIENSIAKSKNRFRFFNRIRQKLSPKIEEITLKNSYGRPINNLPVICGEFNKYFSLIFQKRESSHFSANNFKDLTIISSKMVEEAIRDNSGSRGTGIDDIPQIFWSSVSPFILKPITNLFNKFLKYGYFPETLKTCILRPLYKKKGSKLLVENYRPIAIQCTFTKIFERILLSFIRIAVEHKLSNKQHGFLCKKSTLTNLLSFYGPLYRKLDSGESVDIVTIDMQKAFDTIDISLLLTKLSNYGVSGSIVNVLSAYLIARRQCVQIDASRSNFVTINSGLPQGSVLSPFLFTIFINDIFNEKIPCSIVSFADDIKIGGTHGINIQTALNQIAQWSEMNLMKVNIDKCESLHLGPRNFRLVYYLYGSPIKDMLSLRDLGLVLDESLQFHSHTATVSSKSHRLIGLIFKIFRSKNSSLYIDSYRSYVLPLIDYLSVFYVFQNHSNYEKIESIQRFFTYKLFKRLNPAIEIPDYTARLGIFGMEPLAARYGKIYLMSLYKIIHKHIGVADFNHSFSSRHPNRLLISRIKTARYRSSFFHKSLTLWNTFIKQQNLTSLPAFKKFICNIPDDSFLSSVL